ncbi:MAG: CoF synthetase [Pseudomonadota bacterium]
MTLTGTAIAVRAFAATLTRAATLRDRSALEAWQAKRLDAWLRQTGMAASLSDVPITQRATLLADFAAFNRLGLSAETATAMALGRMPAPPHTHIGLSTGTVSGTRMPYVISDAERFVWLGTILAKTLGWAALQRPRVAVVLPQGSALYDAARDGRALPLCFVPLTDGFAQAQQVLEAFAPDVIVAPPRVLTWLARRGTTITPRRVFAAAELLDPPDQSAIRAAFPAARLGEIYMATEGLFAVTCPHGTLHLAEDCVHLELIPQGDGTVEPVVTDFTRRAQTMARYRTGDLLREVSCDCASPLRAVKVAGRASDRIEGVAPDILRDAVLTAGVEDFRLVQSGSAAPILTLAPGVPSDPARQVLQSVLGRRVKVETGVLTPPEDCKLRRVMRVP